VSRKVIHMKLSTQSIDAAIKELTAYKADVEKKAQELVDRLAAMGATNASLGFSRAVYTGDNDVTVTVEDRGPGKKAVVAAGSAVLFIEFGAGARYGYGHPWAGELGMGPGTYPDGKGHWDDHKGWYIPGGEHTYGNPPNEVMFQTSQELQERITEIAREVFGR